MTLRPVTFRRLIRRLPVLLLKTGLIVMLASAGLVLALRFVDPPIWAWKINRTLNPPAGYPRQPQQSWVSFDQIALPMQLSVIAAEDQRFPGHFGFDLDAIADAVRHNERHRQMRGASTITQQTAKNLFLWPSRSFIRKGIEAWFSLLLECLWSKQRILEVYLNVVEFGPGIYGVEAASQHYFHKSARNLQRWEAARLAAVLPNPYRYRANPASPYVEQRSRWIAQQMEQLGLATLKSL